MKIMRSIRYAVLSLALVAGMSSCQDFFDILPLSDIVLEGFYTEENDITSVVTSCYAGLETADCINRMAVWGEMRSENISSGSNLSNDESQILKENITTTTKYSNWLSFYTVINRCNTVLYYAPLVNEKDPNYTASEMNANIAEVKAIRALCYFYLIRAFRDVPFVTEPSIDDSQDYHVAASSFSDILNFLIDDLDAVKDNAIRRYSDDINNTSRFTRYSIYALLADMYLWKGEYAKCVELCDKVIAYKTELYKDEVAAQASNTDLELYTGIPLISEEFSGSVSCGNSATQIFGEGNSFESIFELNFVQNQSVANTFVANYYGNSSTSLGYFSATSFLIENLASGANKIFKNTDCRPLSYIQKATTTQYAISKYTCSMVSFSKPLSSDATSPTVGVSPRSGNYANWIIYRLTDIVLMKAEASIQLGKSFINDTVPSATTMKPYLQTAFRMVSAVYNRANNKTTASTDTLKYSSYNTVSAMEDLVLLERQRELMFEGKRWFDLVRLARREGKNDNLITFATKKQTSNLNPIKIKLSSPDGLYFPYSESELKLNPLLIQNPAYETDESSTVSE
jgi:starch-binding outer membrane protein, SusD/RagB family